MEKLKQINGRDGCDGFSGGIELLGTALHDMLYYPYKFVTSVTSKRRIEKTRE